MGMPRREEEGVEVEEGKELLWDMFALGFPNHTQAYTKIDNIISYRPSDALALRCIYHNTADEQVAVGAETGEELCALWLFYYELREDQGGHKPVPTCDDSALEQGYDWGDYPDYLGSVPMWVEWYSYYLR